MNKFTLRLCLFATAFLGSSASAYPMTRDDSGAKYVPVLMAEQKGDHDQVLPLSSNIIQLFRYLETAADLKFDLRRYPWRRVLHNAENGEGIILGIYKTPEREKIFAFSEPVFWDRIWLVSRCADKMVFNAIPDLKGKTIGIIQGSSAGLEFDSQVNILFKAEYNTSSLSSRFYKLQQKRMDAFLLYEPRTNLKEVQRELNQIYASEIDEYKKKKIEVFCILPKPISTISVHFATSLAGDKSALERIDKALIVARKKGDLDRLFSK